MIKEWLPQFITAACLFVFAATGSVYLAKTDEGKEEMWSHWVHVVSDPPEENRSESVNRTILSPLPPPHIVVWSTSVMWAAAGFYAAAGISAVVHRTRPEE